MNEATLFEGRINTNPDKTTGIKQNFMKRCVVCCPPWKINFKNWFIPTINKPKMCYSLSIKEKEMVSKVDLVIFTVHKSYPKNLQLHIRNNVKAAVQKYSITKVFLEISENSQENTCALGLQLYKKRVSGTGVFLWILRHL